MKDSLAAKDVHDQLRGALAEMHRAEQSVFLWFSEMSERSLFRDLGYGSIHAYASEELGFTTNRINRYLHLAKALEGLPRIRRALYAGTLPWTKARVLVRVSSPATEERWLAAALRLGRRDLEAKAAQARAQAAGQRRQDPAQPMLAARPEKEMDVAIAAPAATAATVVTESTAATVATESTAASAAGVAAATAGRSRRHETPIEGAEEQEVVAAGCSAALPNDRQEAAAASWLNARQQKGALFGPPSGDRDERLIDDGPISVTFRLAPIDLARHESQLERLHKQGIVKPGTTREQILLQAFDALIAAGSVAVKRSGIDRSSIDRSSIDRGGIDRRDCSDHDNADGCSDDASRGESSSQPQIGPGRDSRVVPERDTQSISEPNCQVVSGGQPPGSTRDPHAGNIEPTRVAVPRGTAATTYQIVIYKCELCCAATVQTLRGPKRVGPTELAAAQCDAVIIKTGQRNRSVIPPAVRQAVLVRDQHRCQAPGCRNTRFLELHHIQPREKGGTNRAENLLVLCSACHRLWHERRLE